MKQIQLTKQEMLELYSKKLKLENQELKSECQKLSSENLKLTPLIESANDTIRILRGQIESLKYQLRTKGTI